MSRIGQFIREARRRASMTQDELASAVGCSKAQLSLMETGRRRVTEARARQMEGVLGMRAGSLVELVHLESTPADIRERLAAADAVTRQLTEARRGGGLDALYKSGELRRLVEEWTSNVGEPLPLPRRIPVINKVAAGYPREFTDLDYPASVADEYIACPDVTDPDAFAARVVGDSMEPEYREGDLVIFAPSKPTPSGSDCFVRLERDNETTFKRVFYEDGAAVMRLQPLNQKYPPREVHREEVSGLYAASYAMRRL